MEIWKPVRGFEVFYEVSDFGRVRSLPRTTTFKDGRVRSWSGQILTQHPCSGGYLFATLCVAGKYYPRKVHKLVLEAFVGPCPKGMECRHFPDPDPTNNCLVNLSWASHDQNMSDRATHGSTRLSLEKIVAIKNLKGAKSQGAIAKQFGVHVGTVWMLHNGKGWKWVEAELLKSGGF